MINLPQPSEFCKITFDRSARVYRVRNGHEIATFPSGKDGKEQAMWAAVKHDGIEVYNVARDFLAEHPAVDGLEARVLKAARMLQRGHLTTLSENNGQTRALVKSESQPDITYTVTTNLTPLCDCDDHERARANRFGHQQRPGAPNVAGLGIVCKHVVLTILAQRLASEREQQAQRKLADKAYHGFPGDGGLTPDDFSELPKETKLQIEQQRRRRESNAARVVRQAREQNARGSATLEFALSHQGDLGRGNAAARMNGWDF